MTDRKLMQQALDLLEKLNKDGWILADFEDEVYASIEALRVRLAQPEQEPIATLFGSLPVYDVPPAKPVAWVENLENARPHCVTDLKYCSVAQHERGEHLKYIPLYPAPSQRKWQGLTDEEQLEIMKMFGLGQSGAFADAIEAKLKEKNNG